MKSFTKFLPALALVAALTSERAIAGYQTVSLSGFNEDLIANGIGAASTSTSTGVDNGPYTFIAADWQLTSASSPLSYGLNATGQYNSPSVQGLSYQLENYSSQNGLKLTSTNATGTLSFNTPVAAAEIFVLGTSGSGSSSVNMVVTFSDNTTQTFSSISVLDWFNNTPIEVGGIGRINTTNNVAENPSGGPRLYKTTLSLSQSNWTKQVSSITFTRNTSSSGVPTFYAVSINTPCTGTPSAGTAAAGVSTACPSTGIALSLSGATTDAGINYQWQVSTNNGATWSSIASATTSSYTVTGQTAASLYRAYLVCSTSSLSDTSSTVAVAQSPFSVCYCTPVSTGTNEYIDSVAISTLSNATNANATNGYADFTSNTSLTTTLNQGGNYAVYLGVRSNAANSQGGMWIDYDHSGSFDASEYTFIGGSSLTATHITLSTVMSIPTTALTGQTRVRFRWRNSAINATDACTSGTTSWYGETEDYFITIAAPNNCSGTPPTTTATTTADTVCPNTAFTLSATGITFGISGYSYQWQSSPAGQNNYANLGAAQSNPNYTIASQTVATDYRLLVTCTNSSLSTTSSVITVEEKDFMQCYCTPSTNFSCSYGAINNVSLNTLSNSSNCSTPYYTAYPTSTATTTLLTDSSYNVTINLGRYAKAGMWIDYDHSGTFDASEYSYIGNNTSSSSTSVTTPSVTITVPSSALTGQTKMRIKSQYNPNTSTTYPLDGSTACNNSYYGESEDYIITIASPVPCSGTPPATTATASVTSTCTGTSFTLGVTGISASAVGFNYQWQSSPSGQNSYANMGTASSTATYQVTGQTAPTDYRVIVTCTSSSQSATSSSVTVGQNSFLNCYCLPVATGTNEYIRGVDINTLTNASNANSSNGFGDYTTNTALTTTLAQGTSYTVTFDVRSNASGSQGGMWIDYDHSGTFDASEYFYIGGSSLTASNVTLTNTLTIPTTALAGQTRVRFRWRNSAITATDACTSGSTTWYGETEDYLITITTNPLPITLESFVAQNAGSANIISWKTATETNGIAYELERSTDARIFTTIAKIEGGGRGSLYEYTDGKAANGMNYYRLHILDNGKEEYSNTVQAFVKANGSFAVSAFPNPATTSVTVQIFGTANKATIQLTDISGKVLRTVVSERETTEINVADLPAGIYFIKYSNNEHNSTIKINKL